MTIDFNENLNHSINCYNFSVEPDCYLMASYILYYKCYNIKNINLHHVVLSLLLLVFHCLDLATFFNSVCIYKIQNTIETYIIFSKLFNGH